jgi:chromosome segregation ATPase
MPVGNQNTPFSEHYLLLKELGKILLLIFIMDYGQAAERLLVSELEEQVHPKFLEDGGLQPKGSTSESTYASKIQLLESEIHDLEVELDEKERQCLEQDKRIQLLQAEQSDDIRELSLKYNDCKSALDAAEKELEKVNLQLAEKIRTLDEVEEELFQQRERMGTLEDTLQRRETELNTAETRFEAEKNRLCSELKESQREKPARDQHGDVQATMQQEGKQSEFIILHMPNSL